VIAARRGQTDVRTAAASGITVMVTLIPIVVAERLAGLNRQLHSGRAEGPTAGDRGGLAALRAADPA
jgi:hypothetical protein